MSKGKIAGIIAGCICGVALVAFGVVMLLRGGFKKESAPVNEPVVEETSDELIEEIQEEIQEEAKEDSNETTEEKPQEETVSPDIEEPVETEVEEKEETMEDMLAKREELASQYGYGYETGMVLPDTVKITDMNGNIHPITDFLGMPLYMNLFTTWCGPCNAEMPDLQKTANQYEGQVQFALIDMGDTVGEIQEFVNQHRLSIPMYYTGDYLGTVYIESIPRHMVLDKYGRIVEYIVGGLDGSSMIQLCEEAIEASK